MATVSGGNKLSQRLTEMADALGGGASVDVGFMSNATYPDGTSVALVAAVQEWGSPSRGIPPRPFFRRMIADKAKEWPKAIADLLVANKYDAAKTMAQTGAGVKGQLQQSIIDLREPALAPSTIARKKSSKPLIDSGVMLRAVDYRVNTPE